jgi:hypothetical protein
MLGRFNSEGYADTLKNKKGGLASAMKNLNRTLGTFYSVSDIIDYEELSNIKSKYDNIPLGLNNEDRKLELRKYSKTKIQELKKDTKENIKLMKDQKIIDKERIKNQIEEEKKFKLQQKKNNITQSQAPASMTLPKLDNTMMASMTAGSAGDIDPTTLLTSNETALLSPSEQAYYINKRRA